MVQRVTVVHRAHRECRRSKSLQRLPLGWDRCQCLQSDNPPTRPIQRGWGKPMGGPEGLQIVTWAERGGCRWQSQSFRSQDVHQPIQNLISRLFKRRDVKDRSPHCPKRTGQDGCFVKESISLTHGTSSIQGSTSQEMYRRDQYTQGLNESRWIP